ncbi:hypothetical protein GE21DRAFT_6230 [Neurospora crassa]|uniref:Uncharacterized protein n=1 Tax=Neurospora crassa (strain ATCC 24698 / 74-OR23-1A / CBS 708.71 / DSM 1257 / FGSC 987) TaxID=367110 RepID=V5IP77_NEUCR|nr:hypothetical protein NCU16826 [Neurospora crassa OR74A]ESA42979.1 hypothetical protein NCU16826 [Neurospora crassa OR74A]KHE84428.1 hypothetical protein GE21DRAFT_6230 [Neurospora crassa]|eukprot:XP_011394412.1 hypothetical protein NCU16826 [Neurospora crassa OR74A]
MAHVSCSADHLGGQPGTAGRHEVTRPPDTLLSIPSTRLPSIVTIYVRYPEIHTLMDDYRDPKPPPSTMFHEMEMIRSHWSLRLPSGPCCDATGASSHRTTIRAERGLYQIAKGDDRGSLGASKPIRAPGSAYLRGCRANKAPISFTQLPASL